MTRARLIPIAAAAALLLSLAVLHALGWREHVSVLSGTVPGAGGTIGQGVLYALVWFAAVVLAPIAVLATGIDALLMRWAERPSATPAPKPPAS